jgi:hypothetical protein
MVYERPWGIVQHEHHLTLLRCGRPGARAIRCRGLCFRAAVGDGLLTWSDGSGAHALDLRTGRRLNLGRLAWVDQAGRTLVVTRRRGPTDYRVRSIRLVRVPD